MIYREEKSERRKGDERVGGGGLHCDSTSLIPCYCSIFLMHHSFSQGRNKQVIWASLVVLGCESQSKRRSEEKEASKDMRGRGGRGGGGGRKYSVGGRIGPPSSSEQQLTSECVRCVG